MKQDDLENNPVGNMVVGDHCQVGFDMIEEVLLEQKFVAYYSFEDWEAHKLHCEHVDVAHVVLSVKEVILKEKVHQMHCELVAMKMKKVVQEGEAHILYCEHVAVAPVVLTVVQEEEEQDPHCDPVVVAPVAVSVKAQVQEKEHVASVALTVKAQA